MLVPPNKFKWTSVALSVSLVVLGGGILYLSLSRVGLEVLAKESASGKLGQRVVYIESDSNKTYRLPVPGLLPTNPLYWAKELRNTSWLSVANKEQKVDILMALADKNWAEMLELWEKGETVKAIVVGEKAIGRLEKADSLISLSKISPRRAEQENKLREAGRAYEKILTKIGGSEGESERLFERLHEWNKKQTQDETAEGQA